MYITHCIVYSLDYYSLINLIMSRDAAKTSPDALACATTHAPYDVTISGTCFRL
ncbi:hypothetical protein BDR03DRAFT_941780 [Suillus americanus]|nr:hypothetical protein BDR03DRAFT_941780 [Suillus americanus]